MGISTQQCSSSKAIGLCFVFVSATKKYIFYFLVIFWHGCFRRSGLSLCLPWCSTLLLLFVFWPLFGFLSCLVVFFQREREKPKDNKLGCNPSSHGEHCLGLSYPPYEWVRGAPSWAAVGRPPATTLWLRLVWRPSMPHGHLNSALSRLCFFVCWLLVGWSLSLSLYLSISRRSKKI